VTRVRYPHSTPEFCGARNGLAIGLGASLLVASIAALWVTVYSIWARPPEQWVSPVSIIWYTLMATPNSVNSPQTAALSLVYICATLATVGLAIPLVRGTVRGERFATLALVAIMVTVPSFFSGLFALLFLPMSLEFGEWFSNVTVSVGIPCAILGGLLAIIGLTDMAR
jgi:hypothetical protein